MFILLIVTLVYIYACVYKHIYLKHVGCHFFVSYNIITMYWYVLSIVETHKMYYYIGFAMADVGLLAKTLKNLSKINIHNI